MTEKRWFLTCYIPLKPPLPMLQSHCPVYQDCIRIAPRLVFLVFTSMENNASMLLLRLLLWPFSLWGVIVKSMENGSILYKSLPYAVIHCTLSLPGCGSVKSPTFIHYRNQVILVGSIVAPRCLLLSVTCLKNLILFFYWVQVIYIFEFAFMSFWSLQPFRKVGSDNFYRSLSPRPDPRVTGSMA